MRLVVVEFLGFGLARLAAASAELGAELLLFTANRSRYDYELNLPDGRSIQVVDVDPSDIDSMENVARKFGDVAGVIGNTDTFGVPAIDLATRLGLPHANREAIALVRDKRCMRDRLNEQGLSSGGGIRLEPLALEITEVDYRFPLIVKDSSGLGSMNVWLVHDREQLAEAFAKCDKSALLGSLFAEPLFRGPLFSAEAVTFDHQTKVLGITSRTLSREFPFREESFSFPVDFAESTKAHLDEWVAGVLRAVSFDCGFSHVEFILTEHGPEVVEINPRIGGVRIGESICVSYGINIYTAMAEIALGRRPGVLSTPLVPRCGFAQMMLYAPSVGTLKSVSGKDAIEAFPGSPHLLQTAPDGALIQSVADHRGIVAMLTATGENSELAWHNADTAVAAISANMI